MSKHGVITLSETLFRDLRLAGSEIGVSVLCPGLVMTNIFESHRNRPAELVDGDAPTGLGGMIASETGGVTDALGAFGEVLTPDQVGAAVLDAVVNDRFHILTHREISRALVRARTDDILEDRPPSALRG